MPPLKTKCIVPNKELLFHSIQSKYKQTILVFSNIQKAIVEKTPSTGHAINDTAPTLVSTKSS